MMTPAALFNKLAANAPLVALVSTRFTPSPKANMLAPYIIWARVSSDPMTTMGEATGNQFDLIQFSIFAVTFDAAESVANALIAALDNQALSTGDSPTFQGRRDMGMDTVENLYRIDVDFLV